MPNRRHTPPRKRMICPICHRDVSYTFPWEPGPNGLTRDFDSRVLKAHTNPMTHEPCTVNGPAGLGIYWPVKG